MTRPRELTVENKSRWIQLTALAFSMLAICVLGSSFWLDAFIKLPEMRLPYKVLFIFTLLGFLLFYLIKLPVSVLRGVVYGALAGQMAAFTSLIFANFCIPNGIDRTIRSGRIFGVADVILLDFGGGFVLGGWLFGILFFMVFGWLRKKFLGREQ